MVDASGGGIGPPTTKPLPVGRRGRLGLLLFVTLTLLAAPGLASAHPGGAEGAIAQPSGTAPAQNFSEPSGIAYDPANGEMYVADSGSNEVGVISDARATIVGTVPVGRAPAGVAYDAGRNEIFVTNKYSSNVSVIAAPTDRVVASIPVGSVPVAAAYDNRTGEVFVANEDSENVSVLSDASDTVVASIPVGVFPSSVAYDGETQEIYVANEGSGNVSVLSEVTDQVVATVRVPHAPVGLVYDRAKGEVFVSQYGSGSLAVIAAANRTVVATVPSVGPDPFGLAYDPARGQIFVALFSGAAVGVVSDTTDALLATIPVGRGPIGLAYDGNRSEVYATSYTAGNVSVLAAATQSVVTRIPTPFPVLFAESGLPAGAVWEIEIDGAGGSFSVAANSTTLVTSIANGSYSYLVSPTGAYYPLPGPATASTFAVAGERLAIALTFAFSYPVTFREQGLPAYLLWGVDISVPSGGTAEYDGAGTAITFYLPNGSFDYVVDAPDGYAASAGTGSGSVVGGPVSIPTLTISPNAGGSSAFSDWIEIGVVGTIVVVVVGMMVAEITRRRGRRPTGSPDASARGVA